MYFLGAVTGVSGAANNQASGGFVIPPGVKNLYLVASATGCLFELGFATGSTGSTFQTNANRGAPLEPNTIKGAYKCVTGLGMTTVVGIFNPGGNGTISVRVYAGANS